MKKKNPLTLLVGALLLLMFLALLFCFQVRTTEVAVVTRFGRYSRSYANDPGLKFRLPLPIEQVYRIDSRISNFERKFEETTTRDAKNVIITVFVGWKVQEPKTFLERFNGDSLKAERDLENLVRNAKNAVIGSYNFSDLVSPDPKQVKFDAVEQDILKVLKAPALEAYGISIELVGIKQLGLPESITGKVFERMKAERDRLVKQYNGEGEAKSLEIRSEANRRRDELLSRADADALRILGEADAAASKDYAVFEQRPDLAIFLLQLKALRESLKDRATLILDEKIPPLNLLSTEKAPATR
jgi:membrane protease subunit HflC